MLKNEYEEQMFYGEPIKYIKNDKFFIQMIDKSFGEEIIKYKKYKCIDGWSKNCKECWQFSKQGAKKIINRLKEREYKNKVLKGLIDFQMVNAFDEV